MTEEDLDALIHATREQLEAELDAERATVRPDFAAMVARARECDPEHVPAAWLSDAERLAPIVELCEARAPVADRQLEGLIHDARTLAERDVAAVVMPPPDAFSRPGYRADALIGAAPGRAVTKPPRSTSSIRRPSRWLLPIGLAAALAGLLLAMPTLLERLVDAARGEARTDNQAEFRTHDSDPLLAHPRVEPSRSTSPQEAVVVPEPERQVDPEQPESAREPIPAVEPAEQRKPSKAEQILALDEEAQRRWAQGELEAAAEAFRAIVKLAGRSRHADLAYGDLFTLARQRGDDAEEAALWREYLEEFPDGRFADDARAGLCRRSTADELKHCWQAYLDDFPKGVHRRAAERALER